MTNIFHFCADTLEPSTIELTGEIFIVISSEEKAPIFYCFRKAKYSHRQIDGHVYTDLASDTDHNISIYIYMYALCISSACYKPFDKMSTFRALKLKMT